MRVTSDFLCSSYRGCDCNPFQGLVHSNELAFKLPVQLLGCSFESIYCAINELHGGSEFLAYCLGFQPFFEVTLQDSILLLKLLDFPFLQRSLLLAH